MAENITEPRGEPPEETKPADWLTGKGEAALRIVFDILSDPETKTSERLAAAKLIAEYDIGRPLQKQEPAGEEAPARVPALEESLRIIRELLADG